MNEEKSEKLNLQIRKMLKEFGVKSHNIIGERLKKNKSGCFVSLSLEIDNEKLEEIKTEIKLD